MASGLAGHSRETVLAEPNVTETKCRLQEYEYSDLNYVKKIVLLSYSTSVQYCTLHSDIVTSLEYFV